MAPVFFLSYAREDSSPFLLSFYDALVSSVRDKLGGELEGKGFIDRNLQVGDDWPLQLAESLQGCRVFVPLYSATYFSKVYCGKEWAVFRARQDAHVKRTGDPRPSLVVPVLWGAKEDLPATVPEKLLDLQFDTQAFADSYARYGLNVLMRQGKYADAREEVIEVLARKIKKASESLALAPLENSPDIKKVEELFPQRPAAKATTIIDNVIRRLSGQPAGPDGGPRFVQLVLVAGSKGEFGLDPAQGPDELRRNRDYYGDDCLEWRPYRPGEERRAGTIAMQVAADRDFILKTPEALDERLVEQLKEAESQNRIVVLLVDTWTLRIARYRQMLQDFDKGNYLNASVLVLWDSDKETAESQEMLDQLVKATFYHRAQSKEARIFISPVKSAEEFRHELSAVLETTRRRIREHAELMRKVTNSPRPTF